MEAGTVHTHGRSEIHCQKMHLTVTELSARSFRESPAGAKREIEKQLFQIFRKYRQIK